MKPTTRTLNKKMPPGANRTAQPRWVRGLLPGRTEDGSRRASRGLLLGGTPRRDTLLFPHTRTHERTRHERLAGNTTKTNGIERRIARHAGDAHFHPPRNTHATARSDAAGIRPRSGNRTRNFTEQSESRRARSSRLRRLCSANVIQSPSPRAASKYATLASLSSPVRSAYVLTLISSGLPFQNIIKD